MAYTIIMIPSPHNYNLPRIKGEVVYLVQNPKTAYRTIKDESVIVDLNNSLLYSLNPVASIIWEMSNGKTEIKQIIDRVKNEFDIERSVAEGDCMEFADDFIQKGLLIILEQ